MALVTVSSIYQSIAIGIFMMMSTGWTLLHNHMSRDYATRVTVTMGVTYLCYSAYYVSLPNSAFRIFMEAFIIFTYSYIFYFSLKYITRSLWIIDRFCLFMEANRVDNLLRATRLKSHLMSRYLLITIFFFSEQIIFQGVIPMILEYFTKNLYFTTTIDMIQQIVDLVVYGWLLFNFRARNWPEFFMIASFELGNLSQFLVGNAKSARIHEALISPDILNSSFRTCKSEYEDMILNSMSNDSDSNLNGLNVVLINPSFEENYKLQGYNKVQQDGSLYQHITIGKKIKSKKTNDDESRKD